MPAPAALSAPSLGLFATEPLRGAIDRVAGLFVDTAGLPRGDGRPVIVYPGLGGSGRATASLRRTLARIGWDAHDWEGGLNRGPRGGFDAYLDRLAVQIERLADSSGRAPNLVGWSLGGVYARELARRMPRSVHRVVTLGTPVRGGPESTRAGSLYRLLSGEPARVDAAMRARLERALHVPHASVWSRADGVVAWRTCVVDGPRATNVEVANVSHFGLVAHPAAVRGLAHALADSRPGRAQARERPDSQRAQSGKSSAAAFALAARQS